MEGGLFPQVWLGAEGATRLTNLGEMFLTRIFYDKNQC
jgi:hypothetical protein